MRMYNFYLLQKDNTILISNQKKDKIVKKYGNNYEILNSVKDKDSVPHLKVRLLRNYPNVEFKEWFWKKRVFSDEVRAKMAKSHTGLKHSAEVKAKMSRSHAGKSNHTGKKHTEETKKKISKKMKGTQYGAGKKIIYNPTTDTEKRIKNLLDIPKGYRIGRDPEVIQTMHSALRPSHR